MVQFPAGQKIFLFEMFRSALVHTHPPLQCIMGYFFPGVGWLQCEADLYQVPRLRMCVSNPTCLHAIYRDKFNFILLGFTSLYGALHYCI
jgi:hypothetical protein